MAKDMLLGQVLIVGAGAIGGVTGITLHQNDIDVSFVNRKSAHFDKVKKDGIIIEGQEKPVKIPIYSSLKDVGRKFEHILVVVKNLNTEEVMKNIKHVSTDKTLVYSMQNGFGNTDIMRKYLPENQVVAGVVGWGANKIAPGVIRITSTSGDFIIGFEHKKSSDDPKLLQMQKWLNFWKRTEVADNILGFRWSKLVVNSIIAPMGGLLGWTLGELVQDPRTAKIIMDLKDEGIFIGEAQKIELEKVDNIDIRSFFYRPKPKDGFFKKLKNKTLSAIIKRVSVKRHGKIRSSLLWDLENGRKTEVDFLNGYIARKAKELGLEVPVNSFLVKAIHEIEDGKREIGEQNLSELQAIADISREKVKEQERQL
ncbi:MAG: ketopantoate reductase family protein [Asgard group archaeon]|nr:ketopantoate reductase family protein [Asgard group archaeon]